MGDITLLVNPEFGAHIEQYYDKTDGGGLETGAFQRTYTGPPVDVYSINPDDPSYGAFRESLDTAVKSGTFKDTFAEDTPQASSFRGALKEMGIEVAKPEPVKQGGDDEVQQIEIVGPPSTFWEQFEIWANRVGLPIIVLAFLYQMKKMQTKTQAKDRIELAQNEDLAKAEAHAEELRKQAAEEVARNRDYIAKYGEDLTVKVKDLTDEPALGREAETRKLTRVLTRPRGEKTAGMLLGEAGVGKTAIVEQLAWLISKGQVPELSGYKVLMLDIGRLATAGDGISDIPQAVMGIIDQAIKDYGKVVIFLDEIHLLMTLGTHSNSKMGMNEYFKAAMGRGELKVIGSTTYGEYQTNIESNRAFARRFNEIMVYEPTGTFLKRIVNRKAAQIALQEGVTIAEDAIAEVIKQSRGRYKGAQPDCSLTMLQDLVDHLHEQNIGQISRKTVVDRSLVETFISDKVLEKLQMKVDSLVGQIRQTQLEVRETGVEIVFDNEERLGRVTAESYGQAIQRLTSILRRVERIKGVLESGEMFLPDKIHLDTNPPKKADAGKDDGKGPPLDPPATGGAVVSSGSTVAPRPKARRNGSTRFVAVPPMLTPLHRAFAGEVSDSVATLVDQTGRILKGFELVPVQMALAGGALAGGGETTILMPYSAFEGNEPVERTAGRSGSAVGGSHPPVSPNGLVAGGAHLAGELTANAAMALGIGAVMHATDVPAELHLPTAVGGIYAGNLGIHTAFPKAVGTPTAASMGLHEMPGMMVLSVASAVALDQVGKTTGIEQLEAGENGNLVGSVTLGAAPWAVKHAFPKAAIVTAAGKSPAFVTAGRLLGATGAVMLGEAVGGAVIYSFFKVQGVVTDDPTAVDTYRLNQLAWSLVDQENGIELPLFGGISRGIVSVAGIFAPEAQKALEDEVDAKRAFLVSTAKTLVEGIVTEAMAFETEHERVSYISNQLTAKERKEDGLTDLIFLVAGALGVGSRRLELFTRAFDKEGELKDREAFYELIGVVAEKPVITPITPTVTKTSEPVVYYLDEAIDVDTSPAEVAEKRGARSGSPHAARTAVTAGRVPRTAQVARVLV